MPSFLGFCDVPVGHENTPVKGVKTAEIAVMVQSIRQDSKHPSASSTDLLVELIGHYSKHAHETKELEDLLRTAEQQAKDSPRRSRPAPHPQRFRHEVGLAIVKAYESGMTVYQVAELFDCSRQVVSNYVKRAGKSLRPLSIGQERIESIHELHAQGLSAMEIAAKLSVHESTVRRYLRS